MPGDVYPKFRAAAVQAAPVFLDRDATIDKLDTLVQKAGDASETEDATSNQRPHTVSSLRQRARGSSRIPRATGESSGALRKS
jgi:hypothetical protein